MLNTYHISLGDLVALPTLTQGQADDLKIDTGTERVWLSRMTVEDGMEFDNEVTVERYDPTNGWYTHKTLVAR